MAIQYSFFKTTPFWIVWSPQGVRTPRFRHGTPEQALNECVRLAKEKPGNDFYAMEVIGHAIQPKLKVTTLHPSLNDDDIPF